MSKKRNYQIVKQTVIPGFESGRFEPRRRYDSADFANSPEQNRKRDSRVSIRVAGEDLGALERLARAEGVPTQSLLARILHQYAAGELQPAPQQERCAIYLPEEGAAVADPVTSRDG